MKFKNLLAIAIALSLTISAIPFNTYANTPTRGEVITSLYNISANKSAQSNSSTNYDFSDWDSISDSAKPAIEWAIDNGIIYGYDDNTIRADKPVTDQEYNTIISRLSAITDDTSKENTTSNSAYKGNYTNEMKIDKKVDLSVEDGPDSVERMGDHKDSPYYSTLDFYNMSSTDSLTILHNFKTYQQTSEVSCGAASAYMVMNWFGKADNTDEEKLWNARQDHSQKHIGTCLDQMKDMFDSVDGFEYTTTYDNNSLDKETIQNYLKNGIPVMVGWNDFGGHWQVIIGYDDMGTPDYQLDDVLIVADPYDTGDHNQDGYGVYQWPRFIYNFTFYNFFPEGELNDCVYIVAYPAGTQINK